MNDSFPTKSLIQHSRRPSPSFGLKDPPWWLTQYDPRLQWCHSQRSQGEKLLGIDEFGRGTLPYFRGLTNHGNQPLSNWDDPPSIKSFMWFNVRMFRHQLNMVQSCSIHLQQLVMASYSITKNFSHVTLRFGSFCSVLGWHSPQPSHDLHNRLMIGQTPSRSMNFQSPLRRWQESQWDLMGCTLWPSHPPG